MEGKSSSQTVYDHGMLFQNQKEKPKTVTLTRKKWKKLKEDKGVKGIGIIGFGEMGPYLDAFSSCNRSSLLEKMKKDAGLVTELAIIGKHTSEFKTRAGEKALIQPLGKSGSYILIERSGRKKKEPRRLLKKIVNKAKKGGSRSKTLKETLCGCVE